MTSIGTPWAWLGFVAFVVAMLLLDLLVVHRKAYKVAIREALVWSGVWIALALVFAAGTAVFVDAHHAATFLSAYVIEKTLSVDNLVVFVVLFDAFRLKSEYRHRVLFWGVFGALILRAVFIVAGAAALAKLAWATFAFGGLLVFLGARMLVPNASEDAALSSRASPPPDGQGKTGGAYAAPPDAANSGDEGKAGVTARTMTRWLGRHVPMTKGYREGHFFLREGGRLRGTPLVAALLAIEFSDLVFACDSVPAALAVARDPFIVFTSNAFAILGLRSLFFVVSGLMDKIRHLRLALAIILVFIGAKMIFERVWHVPVGQSLAFIGSVLLVFVVGSALPALSGALHRAHSPHAKTPAQ